MNLNLIGQFCLAICTILPLSVVAQQSTDYRIKTLNGILIGVVEGNVTVYEKLDAPPTIVRRVQGNVTRVGMSPLAVRAIIERIAAEKDLNVNKIGERLTLALDKVAELTARLRKDAANGSVAEKTLSEKALFLVEAGRFDEAEALYDESLTQQTEVIARDMRIRVSLHIIKNEMSKATVLAERLYAFSNTNENALLLADVYSAQLANPEIEDKVHHFRMTFAEAVKVKFEQGNLADAEPLIEIHYKFAQGYLRNDNNLDSSFSLSNLGDVLSYIPEKKINLYLHLSNLLATSKAATLIQDSDSPQVRKYYLALIATSLMHSKVMLLDIEPNLSILLRQNVNVIPKHLFLMSELLRVEMSRWVDRPSGPDSECAFNEQKNLLTIHFQSFSNSGKFVSQDIRNSVREAIMIGDALCGLASSMAEWRGMLASLTLRSPSARNLADEIYFYRRTVTVWSRFSSRAELAGIFEKLSTYALAPKVYGVDSRDNRARILSGLINAHFRLGDVDSMLQHTINFIETDRDRVKGDRGRSNRGFADLIDRHIAVSNVYQKAGQLETARWYAKFATDSARTKVSLNERALRNQYYLLRAFDLYVEVCRNESKEGCDWASEAQIQLTKMKNSPFLTGYFRQVAPFRDYVDLFNDFPIGNFSISSLR